MLDLKAMSVAELEKLAADISDDIDEIQGRGADAFEEIMDGITVKEEIERRKAQKQ